MIRNTMTEAWDYVSHKWGGEGVALFEYWNDIVDDAKPEDLVHQVEITFDKINIDKAQKYLKAKEENVKFILDFLPKMTKEEIHDLDYDALKKLAGQIEWIYVLEYGK